MMTPDEEPVCEENIPDSDSEFTDADDEGGSAGGE